MLRLEMSLLFQYVKIGDVLTFQYVKIGDVFTFSGC